MPSTSKYDIYGNVMPPLEMNPDPFATMYKKVRCHSDWMVEEGFDEQSYVEAFRKYNIYVQDIGITGGDTWFTLHATAEDFKTWVLNTHRGVFNSDKELFKHFKIKCYD